MAYWATEKLLGILGSTTNYSKKIDRNTVEPLTFLGIKLRNKKFYAGILSLVIKESLVDEIWMYFFKSA